MNDEIIETKQGIARSELGYLFSLALRKSCDSKPTSLAYVLIGITEFNKAWGRYFDLVWDRLGKSQPFGSVFKAASNDLAYAIPYESALRLTFAVFQTEDWECLQAGIEYFAEKVS